MTYTHIVKGFINFSGQEVYYTGKDGEGWISHNKADAFTFTKKGAIGKAKMLNLHTATHCVNFETSRSVK